MNDLVTRDLVTMAGNKNRYQKAWATSLWVGLGTILLVLTVPQSNNYLIWSLGNFFSGLGNDLFLISTNLLIIYWARRHGLNRIIKLTLLSDFLVWVLVQGIKLLKIEPWCIRPNGGYGGFPSGHATHAFVMAFLLTMLFPRYAGLWYGCAAAISWSRIETGWHNGFQVTVGVVFGIVLAGVLVGRWLATSNFGMISRERAAVKNTLPAPRAYAAE